MKNPINLAIWKLVTKRGYNEGIQKGSKGLKFDVGSRYIRVVRGRLDERALDAPTGG